jgi:hypothetical protein
MKAKNIGIIIIVLVAIAELCLMSYVVKTAMESIAVVSIYLLGIVQVIIYQMYGVNKEKRVE